MEVVNMDKRDVIYLLSKLSRDPDLINFIEEFMVDWLVTEGLFDINSHSVTMKGRFLINDEAA